MLLRNCRQFKSVTPHALRARFACHEGGAIAPIFAVSITVLLLAVAIAMELGRWVIAQNDLQMALDAGVLAGATRLRANAGDEAGALEAARAVYALNIGKTKFGKDIKGDVDFEVNGTMVSAVGQPRLLTILSGVVERADLPLSSKSKASFGSNAVYEVSLMLDVTSSMSGRVGSLKEAAKAFVGSLLSQPNSKSRVAIVPFADGVRLSREIQDKVIESRPKWSSGTYVTPCVSERGGSAAYTDEPPRPGKYFSPIKRRHSDKSTYACSSGPTIELVPLTNDKDKLVSAIDGLVTDGNTAGHLGTAWAWYTLSPKWKNIWGSGSDPVPYENKSVRKVAVLMTDGNYNVQFAANGYKSKSTRKPINGRSEEQALELCKNMKAAGIEIYTVGFRLNTDAKEFLKKCATSEDHAFEPENGEELVNVYSTIGQQSMSLHLAE